MKKFFFGLLALLILLFLGAILYFQFSDCGVSPFSCGGYSTKGTPITQKITLGSGPEDMAIDTSLGYPRIIVSCNERRKNKPKKGGFYEINPQNDQAYKLQIEPADLDIRPHGIDIVTIDSITYLYAISHNHNGENWRHPVYRFKIQGNRLILDEANVLENELMSVPNDLEVLEDGSFYASNYVPNMNPSESTKAILGIKNGSIVHYDGKGNWEIVLKDLCYPNGVWVDKEKQALLIANGGCKEVARYEIQNGKVNPNSKMSTKQHGIDITIGDNLMMDNQGVLWTTAHPCPLKFLDHAEDSKAASPSQVFAIDPNTLKANNYFQTNGELISAASTALRLGDKLYVSQVFNPFVLVMKEVKL